MASSLDERAYLRAVELVSLAKAFSQHLNSERTRVFMDPRELREVIGILKSTAHAVPGCYVVIVGGLAVQELGYERFTKDVDAVVDASRYRDLLDVLRQKGFELQSDRTLKHREIGVELDLLKEGETLKGARLPIPHPRELGPHLGAAHLGGLLRLKLDSPRQKDRADLVEILKLHPQEVDALREQLPEALHLAFLEVAAQARREQES